MSLCAVEGSQVEAADQPQSFTPPLSVDRGQASTGLEGYKEKARWFG